MSFRTGIERMPVVPLVRVWCRRCGRSAGLWVADLSGADCGAMSTVTGAGASRRRRCLKARNSTGW